MLLHLFEAHHGMRNLRVRLTAEHNRISWTLPELDLESQYRARSLAREKDEEWAQAEACAPPRAISGRSSASTFTA
jgi:hypothetical protein